jgi:hypothetical protein
MNPKQLDSYAFPWMHGRLYFPALSVQSLRSPEGTVARFPASGLPFDVLWFQSTPSLRMIAYPRLALQICFQARQ